MVRDRNHTEEGGPEAALFTTRIRLPLGACARLAAEQEGASPDESAREQ
jgi:hypothetical protein